MTAPITTCDTFADGVNAVLDGDAPATLLTESPHFPNCGECRALYAAAVLLQCTPLPLPTPANSFADGVLNALNQSEVADRRRRVVTVASLVALAAAVLVAFTLSIPTLGPNTEPTFAVIPPKAPSVTQSVAQAKDAVATLSEKVLEETMTPARNLFASTAVKAGVPAADPLAELPDAAKAGLEPIGTTTRRAFGTLLRDVNSFASVVKKDS